VMYGDRSSMREMLREMVIDGIDDGDESRDREAVWGPNPKRTCASMVESEEEVKKW